MEHMAAGNLQQVGTGYTQVAGAEVPAEQVEVEGPDIDHQVELAFAVAVANVVLPVPRSHNSHRVLFAQAGDAEGVLVEVHSIVGYMVQAVLAAAAAEPADEQQHEPSTPNNPARQAEEVVDLEAAEAAEAYNSVVVQTGFYSSLFW